MKILDSNKGNKNSEFSLNKQLQQFKLVSKVNIIHAGTTF